MEHIIRDSFFSTYEQEVEPVRYGITRPFRTANPIYAYFHFWMELFQVSKSLHGLRNKIKIWFDRPANFPRIKTESKQEYQEPPRVPKKLYGYLLAQMVVNVIAIFSILLFKENFTMPAKAGLASLMVLSAFTVNMLASRVRWVYYLELSRLVLLLGLIPIGFHTLSFAITLLLFAAGSIAWLVSIRKYFVGGGLPRPIPHKTEGWSKTPKGSLKEPLLRPFQKSLS